MQMSVSASADDHLNLKCLSLRKQELQAAPAFPEGKCAK